MKHLFLLSICLVTILSSIHAQKNNYLDFYGIITLESKKGKSVLINMYDGNKLISSYVTNGRGRFFIDALVRKHYTLEFSKEGYITKRIIVNTKEMPKKALAVGGFVFDVNLRKKKEEIDCSILDFPMALIEFQEKDGDFNFNERHHKQMLGIQSKVLSGEEQVVLY